MTGKLVGEDDCGVDACGREFEDKCVFAVAEFVAAHLFPVLPLVVHIKLLADDEDVTRLDQGQPLVNGWDMHRTTRASFP